MSAPKEVVDGDGVTPCQCLRGPPGGARFSVTVNIDPKIAAIAEEAWTAIRYPRAIWDDQPCCRVSDAQVAEVSYTAFT